MARTTQTKPGVSRVAKRRAGKDLRHGEEYRAAALAVSCLISPVWAQGICVRPQDMTALQTATVQQHFMVAALSCGTAEPLQQFRRDLSQRSAEIG